LSDENEPDPLGKNFAELFSQISDSTWPVIDVGRFFGELHNLNTTEQVAQLAKKKTNQSSFQEFTQEGMTANIKNAIKTRTSLPIDLDYSTKPRLFSNTAYFTGMLNNWLFCPIDYD